MFRKRLHNPSEVLGQAILDHWNGDDGSMIHVRSLKALPQVMDPAIFFRTYEEMPHQEQIALARSRGRILDVGAGAGSHCLWLQEHGLDVTALDLSPQACRVMRQRGLRRVIEGAIQDFRDPDGYDTILMLMNGTGLADSPGALKELLAHIASLLKEGGCILIDSTDVLYMYEQPGGVLRIDLNAAYYGEIPMRVRYRRMRSHPFTWLYADPGMLEDIAISISLDFEVIFRDESGHYLAVLSSPAR